MTDRRGYIAVFGPSGRMVAYTDNSDLFKSVVPQVLDSLPKRAPDHATSLILDARRAALRSLIDGDEGEK
jgi:hypothetical protein